MKTLFNSSPPTLFSLGSASSQIFWERKCCLWNIQAWLWWALGKNLWKWIILCPTHSLNNRQQNTSLLHIKQEENETCRVRGKPVGKGHWSLSYNPSGYTQQATSGHSWLSAGVPSLSSLLEHTISQPYSCLCVHVLQGVCKTRGIGFGFVLSSLLYTATGLLLGLWHRQRSKCKISEYHPTRLGSQGLHPCWPG